MLTLSDEFRAALERALRKKTAYQLSKESGVSEATIGQYLSGYRQTINLDTASRLAAAIGVTLRQSED